MKPRCIFLPNQIFSENLDSRFTRCPWNLISSTVCHTLASCTHHPILQPICLYITHKGHVSIIRHWTIASNMIKLNWRTTTPSACSKTLTAQMASPRREGSKIWNSPAPEGEWLHPLLEMEPLQKCGDQESWLFPSLQWLGLQDHV
jgi:hypothetical protein